MAEKIYEGARTIDGCEVTVNGTLLDLAYDIETITDDGIEWSYEGPGPSQLALAILVDSAIQTARKSFTKLSCSASSPILTTIGKCAATMLRLPSAISRQQHSGD